MKTLKKNWLLLVLRGVTGLIIGILALVWPGLTLEILILILAIHLLVEGIVMVLTGLTSWGKEGHWLALLEGALALVIGWILITRPGAVALTLAFIVQFIAIWLILGGIIRVIHAIAVRKEIKNEFFLITSGILSALVGIWLFAQPGIGILTFIWLFGFSAIIMGIFFIAFGLRLKERD